MITRWPPLQYFQEVKQGDTWLQVKPADSPARDIKNYIYQGKQKPIYHYENQGPKYNVGDHLFFNGPWKLFYNNPATQFLAWYNGRGQKINSYEKQVLKNRYLDRLNSLVNLKN